MIRECHRSSDVAAAASAGELSSAADSELRRHLAECEACRDLALVVTALRGERDRVRREAPAPSAGLVWWRAELRERQEAERRAAAPVTLVHAAAFIAVLVVAVVSFSTFAHLPWAASLADFLPTLPTWSEAAQSVADVSPILRWALALGATAWLILGPVALYLTLRRD
jgi:predicted anti-sigma-YlaC factor YlaD